MIPAAHAMFLKFILMYDIKKNMITLIPKRILIQICKRLLNLNMLISQQLRYGTRFSKSDIATQLEKYYRIKLIKNLHMIRLFPNNPFYFPQITYRILSESLEFDFPEKKHCDCHPGSSECLHDCLVCS